MIQGLYSITSEVEGLGDSRTLLLQKLRDWVIQGLYYFRS